MLVREMNVLRPISRITWHAVLVAAAVILGFAVGGWIGIPVWLQGFFLLPAVFLFCRLSDDPRPSIWKSIGWIALLSVFVLFVSLGAKIVPERYFWAYYILIIVFFPPGPVTRWFERCLTRKEKRDGKAASSDGGKHPE